MSKIVSIEAQVHDALRGTQQSNAYAGKRSLVFVRLQVRLSDDRVGEGFTGRFLAKEVAYFLNGTLGDALIGLDPLTDSDIAQTLMGQFNRRGMTGVVVSALSALDIALYDLRAQAESLPLATYLGDKRKSAPVHVTCGFPSLDLDELIDACLTEMALGVAGVKMLVASSAHTVDEDILRVRAVRDAIGADADLIVDANCGFDLDTAGFFQRQTSDINLTLLEEPVHRNDVRSLAVLARDSIHPISAGQMEQSDDRFEQLISAGIAVLQPNAVFAGGIGSVLDIVRHADNTDIGIGTAGGWDFVNMHWVCGALTNGAVELHRAHDCIVRLLLSDERPQLKGGEMVIGEGFGLGLKPDEKALAACAL